MVKEIEKNYIESLVPRCNYKVSKDAIQNYNDDIAKAIMDLEDGIGLDDCLKLHKENPDRPELQIALICANGISDKQRRSIIKKMNKKVAVSVLESDYVTLDDVEYVVDKVMKKIEDRKNITTKLEEGYVSQHALKLLAKLPIEEQEKLEFIHFKRLQSSEEIENLIEEVIDNKGELVEEDGCIKSKPKYEFLNNVINNTNFSERIRNKAFDLLDNCIADNYTEYMKNKIYEKALLIYDTENKEKMECKDEKPYKKTEKKICTKLQLVNLAKQNLLSKEQLEKIVDLLLKSRNSFNGNFSYTEEANLLYQLLENTTEQDIVSKVIKECNIDDLYLRAMLDTPSIQRANISKDDIRVIMNKEWDNYGESFRKETLRFFAKRFELSNDLYKECIQSRSLNSFYGILTNFNTSKNGFELMKQDVLVDSPYNHQANMLSFFNGEIKKKILEENKQASFYFMNCVLKECLNNRTYLTSGYTEEENKRITHNFRDIAKLNGCEMEKVKFHDEIGKPYIEKETYQKLIKMINTSDKHFTHTRKQKMMDNLKDEIENVYQLSLLKKKYPEVFIGTIEENQYVDYNEISAIGIANLNEKEKEQFMKDMKETDKDTQKRILFSLLGVAKEKPYKLDEIYKIIYGTKDIYENLYEELYEKNQEKLKEKNKSEEER